MTYSTPTLMLVGAAATIVRGDGPDLPDPGTPTKPGIVVSALEGIDA